MENQTVVYEQGVGAVTSQTDEATLTMYPTFRIQSPWDIPTFTLEVTNDTAHDIDFVPENIHAWLDDHECHVYTVEERIGEIRRLAAGNEIPLAMTLGGVSAAQVNQIAAEAGPEEQAAEQAAQAIFQHTTVHPGTTVVGQVMLRPKSARFRTLRLDVPLGTTPATFRFVRSTTNS